MRTFFTVRSAWRSGRTFAPPAPAWARRAYDGKVPARTASTGLAFAPYATTESELRAAARKAQAAEGELRAAERRAQARAGELRELRARLRPEPPRGVELRGPCEVRAGVCYAVRHCMCT